MSSNERLCNALKVLGPRAKVVRKRKPASTNSKKRPRPLSSFIDTKVGSRKDRYFSCEKKHRYDSEHGATTAARLCTQKRGTRLRVYFCEFCGGWHLTSKPIKHMERM